MLELLRKSVVYYSAICSDETPTSFSFDSIHTITQNRIKTELLPVLRNSPFFDVKAAQGECIDYLTQLPSLTGGERKFLRLFKEKQYQPALLFEDANILSRISQHPMALWKCMKKAEKDKPKPPKHKNELER